MITDLLLILVNYWLFLLILWINETNQSNWWCKQTKRSLNPKSNDFLVEWSGVLISKNQEKITSCVPKLVKSYSHRKSILWLCLNLHTLKKKAETPSFLQLVTKAQSTNILKFQEKKWVVELLHRQMFWKKLFQDFLLFY